MKKIELIIPEVKKQEEVSDQLSENEYSFRQKQWDSPIIPSTKVAPELIELLKNYQAPSFELPHSTSVTEAAEFYYQEYAKLFRQNDQLNQKLKQAFKDRDKTIQRYNQLKREQTDFDDNVRRKRRFANEIKRDFPCPMDNCHKSYGTQGSLTQHVKLKHEQFYRTGEYQIELQKMLDAMTQKNTKLEVKKQE